MRLKSPLTIAFILAALPALARDHTLKDGRFTICAFQNFDQCQLLTKSAIRRYHFGAEEKRVLNELKRYVTAKSISAAELEKSFGKSAKTSKVIPHDRPNDITFAWYKDSVGMNDLNAKCPECGIYVQVTDDVVVGLNYIVDQKFTLAWHRAAKR